MAKPHYEWIATGEKLIGAVGLFPSWPDPGLARIELRGSVVESRVSGMSKGRDRTVYRKDNQWAEKGNDAGRAGGIFKTQGEAIDAARQTLHKQGGGELIVKGRDGRIRSKDTIVPGRDPNPPRDREH